MVGPSWSPRSTRGNSAQSLWVRAPGGVSTRRDGRTGGLPGTDVSADYFGAVALILGGAAFGATNPARKNFRRFWIGVFIVSLIWALGGYTPAYHIIMLVPYTKFLRAPSTMIYITSFSTSVFAAMGGELGSLASAAAIPPGRTASLTISARWMDNDRQ